ncbi:uncharacterized protein Mf isoform X3 [Anabrus simplex]|uniref:uncharacterized protein Mf isoform X3 n=1 Tax=Anabrus simplex TaxID=316456 RepID=UPI0034DDC2BE
MLKNHLDMIGRNEPIQRKARFWQSYVRALKGTDDMRAPDPVHRPRAFYPSLYSDFPELSSTWPSLGKSIYDDPKHAVDRISVPGYRYLPVSRETYGYSPRNLYPLPYTSYRPGWYRDALQDWKDHLDRMSALDHLYPAKYPAVPHKQMTPYRELTPVTPERELGYHYPASYNRIQAYKDHLDRMAALDKILPNKYPAVRIATLPSLRDWTPLPTYDKQIGFNYAGQPIYSRGRLARRPLSELLEPLPSMPLSRITRDPWWWDYPELRPFTSPYAYLHPTPFYLRDSYLSPVKRTYLWDKHPIRPFAHIY